MRPTYVDLIAEVRAQIDVDDNQAFAWLLDRSRLLNAEASWLLQQDEIALTGARYYPLPADAIWIEAVLISSIPYQRSTMHALDARWNSTGSWSYGVYADGADSQGTPLIQIHPAPVGGTASVRYVADVPDDRTLSPPFPADFDEALVDGAVAIGLARMDERFDSAGYFDERFANAITRLKRRRHGHIGRGATSIRVVR